MALREILASFGFEVDTSAIKRGEAASDGLLHKLQGLGTAIAGAFALHAVKDFFEATVHGATDLARSAIMYGTTAQELQGLQFAAEMSNVSVESLNMGIMRLQRSLFAAKEGANEGGKAFAALGLTAKELKAMSGPEEQLSAIADAFVKIEDKSTRTGVAMKLFGRGGAQLVPFLMKGSAGIKELTSEVERLGGGFTKDFIEKAEEAHQAQVRLDMATKSLRVTLVTGLMPAAMALIHGLQWLAQAVKDVNQRVDLAGVAFSGLLLFALSKLPAVIGLLKGFMLTTAPILAAWLMLWLVFDDLIGLLTGKDSEIGAIIDHIFGDGAAEAFVADVQVMGQSWQTFCEGLGTLAQAAGKMILNSLGGSLESVGNKIDWVLRLLPQTVLEGAASAVQGGSITKGFEHNNEMYSQAETNARERVTAGNQSAISEAHATFQQIAAGLASRRKEANGGNWVARPGAGEAKPWSMFPYPEGDMQAASANVAPTASIGPAVHQVVNNTHTDNSKTTVNTLPATTATQAREIGRTVAKVRAQQGENRATLVALEPAVE
jgi:hypothetical protein